MKKLLIILFFIVPFLANADYIQTINNSTLTQTRSGGSAYTYQYLGDNLTGFMSIASSSNISVSLGENDSGTSIITVVSIYEMTAIPDFDIYFEIAFAPEFVDKVDFSNAIVDTTIGTTEIYNMVMDSPASYTFIQGRHYFIKVENSSNGRELLIGGNINDDFAFDLTSTSTGNASVSSGIEDIYFIISDINADAEVPLGLTEIIDPINATTTATNDVDIEIEFNNVGANFDHLVYEIYSTLTFQNLVEFQFIPISNATGTFNTTTNLGDGNYEIRSFLYDSTTDINEGVQDINAFSVIENPLEEILGFDPNDFDTITGLATSTCGITNLTGCFQNAITWAFYPNAEALGNFENLIDDIKNKPPFGYFVIYSTAIQNLTESATPVFSLEDEGNITTNIFDPLRTGMNWLLWFVFGVWIYKRVTNINI